jgi:hypothetical protein
VNLAELLVATALTCAILGGVFTAVRPLQAAFATEQEAIDVQQRLRVAVEAITRDLRAAASVRPYRIGALGNDGDAGIHFRSAVIGIRFAASPANPAEAESSQTYFLRAGDHALMQYDGRAGTFPLLEDVVGLAFEYFGESDPLAASMFTDGPWIPEATDGTRFDADLLRVRRVRVRIRLQAPSPFRGPAGPLFVHAGMAADPRRWVPDEEITADVALRSWDAF